DLKATAKKLGLDTAKFDLCLDRGQYDDAINRDVGLGRRLNVTGTPTFFIDGRPLEGAQPEAMLLEVMDVRLVWAEGRQGGASGDHKQKVATRSDGSKS